MKNGGSFHSFLVCLPGRVILAVIAIFSRRSGKTLLAPRTLRVQVPGFWVPAKNSCREKGELGTKTLGK